MLTNWETYKLAEGSWKDFQQKISEFSKSGEPGAGGSDFNINILLEDRYFCKVSVYDSEEKFNAWYVGLDEDTGKEKLEKELGLKLESLIKKDA